MSVAAQGHHWLQPHTDAEGVERHLITATFEHEELAARAALALNTHHALLEMLRECRATFAFAAGEGDDGANDFIAEIDAVLAKAGAEADIDARADNPVTEALRDVIAERKRQIDVEGWSPEHDDQHERGTLAAAAACYALSARKGLSYAHAIREPLKAHIRQLWPFGYDWLKPKNPRADLVRAGALILAEIEAIDRYFEREADIAREERDQAEGGAA